MSTTVLRSSRELRALSAAEATAIDIELMSVPGFSIDQLMELAGLSCAEAIHRFTAARVSTSSAVLTEKPKLSALIFAGPGNNGGDGLVAARHLFHFGWSPTVYYPKRPAADKPLFLNLVAQLECLDIPVLTEPPLDGDANAIATQYDIIIDAVFGFGFRDDRGPIRPPFDRSLALLAALSKFHSKTAVASIDVPSGWCVDGGDSAIDDEEKIQPDLLISLTAPKLCAIELCDQAARVRGTSVVHYLGGRFVPPTLASKYELNLGAAPYEGAAQVVQLTRAGDGFVSSSTDMW